MSAAPGRSTYGMHLPLIYLTLTFPYPRENRGTMSGFQIDLHQTSWEDPEPNSAFSISYLGTGLFCHSATIMLLYSTFSFLLFVSGLFLC